MSFTKYNPKDMALFRRCVFGDPDAYRLCAEISKYIYGPKIFRLLVNQGYVGKRLVKFWAEHYKLHTLELVKDAIRTIRGLEKSAPISIVHGRDYK
jgi:hypothetical protein